MQIFNSIFTLILVYGYPVVGVVTLLSSMGLPLPGTAVVLVAGSLVATKNLNPIALFLLITASSVAGDVIDYFLGKYIGDGVLQKLAKRSKFVRTSRDTTEKYFRRWSGITVFLTRWLFPFAASIVSVIAGISNYSFRKFLFFDILGQSIATIIFLGLGYVFSVNWPYIWDYLSSIPGIVIGAALGFIFILMGLRKLYHVRRLQLLK